MRGRFGDEAEMEKLQELLTELKKAD